jgi:hypothetical protein
MGDISMSSVVEIIMSIGVKLRTQVVGSNGAPTELVQTGGGLRAEAINLGGIISFNARMSTEVIGGAVTDQRDNDHWVVNLLVPAAAKAIEHRDTQLKVTEKGQRVAFRTVGKLEQLIPDSAESDYPRGYYGSGPLDVFAMTS